MDPMAEIRTTFFQECEEQLAAMEAGLLTMDEGDTSADTVNAVFRAVHSIKGGAGAFKLGELVSFAHVFETSLDQIRSGKLVPDADILKVLLRAADVLADLVRDAREGRPSAQDSHQTVAQEIAALVLESGEPVEDEEGFEIDFAPVMVVIDGPFESIYRIGFKPRRSLYGNANEPIALLRELALLGKVDITCDTSSLPPLDLLDASQSYLSWDIELHTGRSESEIRGIFEFADGDCELTVEPATPPESPAVIGAFDLPSEPGAGQTHAAVHPGAAGPEDQPKPAGRPPQVHPSIRVDLDRVDRLINLVGELVINQAMLAQRVHQSGHGSDTRVSTSLDELEHLTRDLQESVMAIRAQPVKPLFQRMSRIVREVAEATGKEVRLRTEGESTEVDKTVLELLADPLTHMIRNAVDHGLEMPARRSALGKTAEGVVRLSAAHRSGRVVIEVADDGAGIDRPRILESAIRKGLVAKDVQLSEPEIDNLLFMPGFSTASVVSNISGRGVGMDVVKRSIQALGGRITISSKPGEGSTFTMSLPLTLAVLDGIIVSIGDQTFVIPLTAIVETLKPEREWLHTLGDNTRVMQIRGKFVPLIDVREELDVADYGRIPGSGVAILVETEKGSRSALLVDAIQDQRQVVIKSLETNYDRVPGVAAATILGDGRVAMILDVDALIGRSMSEHAHADSADKFQTLAMAG